MKEPKRWNEAYASEVLDQATASGLEDRAFAKREGLDPQRLWFWRRKLKTAKRPRRRKKETPAFVELTGLGRVETVEVRLANGRVVTAPVTIEASKLRTLLDVVEGRNC